MLGVIRKTDEAQGSNAYQRTVGLVLMITVLEVDEWIPSHNVQKRS